MSQHITWHLRGGGVAWSSVYLTPSADLLVRAACGEGLPGPLAAAVQHALRDGRPPYEEIRERGDRLYRAACPEDLLAVGFVRVEMIDLQRRMASALLLHLAEPTAETTCAIEEYRDAINAGRAALIYDQPDGTSIIVPGAP